MRFSRSFTRLSCSLALAFVAAMSPSCGGAPVPLETPDIHVPRGTSEAEAPIRLLREELNYTFEADGNYVYTYKRRYRILDQHGVDDWGSIQAGWSPWYMARPEVSAQVFDPEGAAHPLDPATIAEGPAFSDGREVYSDSKVLRAPLPAVKVGSEIECTITSRTTRPFFPGGSVFWAYFGGPIAADSVSLVIDAPEALPLSYDARDAEVRVVKDARAGGRRRLVIEGGPYPALAAETMLPSEAAVFPSVRFSTASGWGPIALAYLEVVKRQTGEPNLGDTVRKLVAASDPPKVKAEKLLRWVREKVRYASVDFGQSAIVPAPPQKILDRAYGDCKDQATLLTALLEAAGVEARVALLSTGPGEDIAAELPGLDAFNHAIVVMPGDPPVWIDPTSPYSRVGELPSGDQGRFALVIDDGTESVVKTPGFESQSSTYTEVRRVWLADSGLARVEETTSGTGTMELGLRGSFDVTADASRAWQKSYIETAYASKKPGALEVGAARDLARKFEIRVEALDAEIGNTYDDAATLIVRAGSLIELLPAALRAATDAPRRAPLAVPVPIDAEMRYIVEPPAGFEPVKLPEPAPLEFGPARFERSFRATASGQVTATFKLSLTKPRLTAAEVDALRAAAAAFMASDAPVLRFEHSGKKLIAAGHLGEGLSVYRRLAEKDPKNATHLRRYSAALLEAGYGEAARTRALRAIEVAPEDADAQTNLGYVMLHDPLGRYMRVGIERATARGAYQRVAERESNATFGRVMQAIVLEHDDRGFRYTSREDTEAALAIYESMTPEALKSLGLDYSRNALFALFRLGRWDEVVRRVRKMPEAEAPTGLLVAAVTAKEGVARGVDEALRVASAKRVEAFDEASAHLVRVRRYAEAAEILERAVPLVADPKPVESRVALLRKVKRREDILAEGGPEALVRWAFAALVAGQGTRERGGDAVFSPRASAKGAIALPDWAFLERSSGAETFHARDLPADYLLDYIASQTMATAEARGDLGFRVSARLIGTQEPVDILVVREGRDLRVRGVGNLLESMCVESREAIARSDTARARRWLEWAAALVVPLEAGDPLGGHPFLRLWKDGKSADLKVATATLCAPTAGAAEALPVLTAARERATDKDAQDALDLAVVHARIATGDHRGVLDSAAALRRAHPTSRMAENLWIAALERLGRHEEYRSIARGRLAANAADTQALMMVANVDEEAGHFAAAREAYEKAIRAGSASPSVYNQAAWLSLFPGGAPDKGLEWALLAAERTSHRDPSILHTLAAVYAETGKTDEARATLRSLVDMHEEGVPRDIDYFILGRVAEHHGLDDVAREAYARLKKPSSNDPTSTYALAEARLAAIAKGRAAKRP